MIHRPSWVDQVRLTPQAVSDESGDDNRLTGAWWRYMIANLIALILALAFLATLWWATSRGGNHAEAW